MRPWAYETADIPGLNATIKQSPDDFIVEELPLFEPSGEGTHLYLTLRKRGVSTFEVADRLARALKLAPKTIGYAGLKDKHGVATQTFSLPGIPVEALSGLELPGVSVVATALHGHKLRRGKLAGNRFSITLRNVDRSRQSEVDEQITRLGEHGVPNYFGTQRYGVRLSNHLIGRALLREDWDEVVGLTLGRPAHADTDPRVHRARELHDAGRLEEAAAEWPRHFAVERAMAVQLVRRPDDARGAVGRLRRRERSLYLNALQSYLFDSLLEQVVIERLDTPPFGLLPGYKVKATDAVLSEPELVAAVLPGIDTASVFRRERLKGARRALRLRPVISHNWIEDGLVLAFDLPSGGYATSVLRELIKGDPAIPRP